MKKGKERNILSKKYLYTATTHNAALHCLVISTIMVNLASFHLAHAGFHLFRVHYQLAHFTWM